MILIIVILIIVILIIVIVTFIVLRNDDLVSVNGIMYMFCHILWQCSLSKTFIAELHITTQ